VQEQLGCATVAHAMSHVEAGVLPNPSRRLTPVPGAKHVWG
jgi:hypothetical protein